MNASLKPDSRLLAWEEFVGSQKVSFSLDRSILESWKRCWGRLNPYQTIQLNPLHPDHLLAAQVASLDFISVARPIMEDLYPYVEGKGVSFALVNSTGYILDMLGDGDFLGYLANSGISTGVFISESQVGTNAFALTLLERIPVQVVGAEHYLQQFQFLAGAAAPIFEISGRLLGAFGLFTFADRFQPPALGLAAAGAQAIEAQRKSEQLLEEQNGQLAKLNAIVNSISEGILVWNQDQVLMDVNEAAAKLIGIPVRSLVGRKVEEVFPCPPVIQSALQNMEPLSEVEAGLKFGDQSFDCLLSLRFVKKQNKVQWAILSFRLGKDVARLVQHQFGSQVPFHLEDIIGETPAMKKIRRLATSAAAAKASILIRGENGSGKTILASAIHHESPRRDGPFLIFSCSSVPTESLLPELLGYEDGAWDHKPGGRLSKFELAQGGTLYLQDVDALTLEVQVVLLNILEIGIFCRLGSDRPIPLDARIIASSSANLEKLIDEACFRSDLYYRLSPFEINLPPLREREGDIPAFVERILSRLSSQLHRNFKLASGVMEMLLKYPWPGNLRELDAVISRAAGQVGVSEMILPEHLPRFIQKPVKTLMVMQGQAEIRSMDEIEGEILLRTANLCRGNISEMARILGIGRTTVWRKLKEYNISIQEYRQKTNGNS